MEINQILKYRVGSHLYGTNIETSDEDFSGIFMPTEKQVFGFEKMEEIDLSKIAKDIKGKNTSEAEDFKLYEFRKFIKLAMENNPNIIEQLFVNEKNLLFQNEIGKSLLDIKHLFPHKGLKQKFLGYAFSQKKKMVIKTDNYYNLKKGLQSLYDYIEVDTIENMTDLEAIHKTKQFMIEIEGWLSKTNSPFIFNKTYIQIGDLNIEKSSKVKQVIKIIERRLNNVGNREELYLKHGFDSKYGMHLVRLMMEGKELLETGKIEFPLKERNLLLDIRHGKYTKEDIIEMSEDFENDIEKITIISDLPSKPQYNKIQYFCIKALKEYLI